MTPKFRYDRFKPTMAAEQIWRLLHQFSLAIITFVLLSGHSAWAVTAGGFHSLASKSDGSLWTWGNNEFGQLGDGTTVSSPLPKQVATGFAAVSAGLKYTLAIKPDRTLWAWGLNSSGQLGDGTQQDRNIPTSIGSDYVAVSAGELHSAAIKTDGSLWAWGYNLNGQIGNGTSSDPQLSPTKIGTDFVFVAAGYQHTLAIKNDGTLWAWGSNSSGQLGDGTTTARNTPVLIGSGFTSVAAGQSHTVALKGDGSLWAWGSNINGQLGNGSFVSQTTPTPIGTGFTSVKAGAAHTVALKADATVWAWGYNGFGQVGDNSVIKKSSPVQIDSGVTSIAAKYHHTLAFKADGSLWAWGYNANGQLGDGTSGSANPPQLKPEKIAIEAGFADQQSPTPPVGVTATPTSSTQASLAWTASTDAVGVAFHKLYRDGLLIAELGNATATNNAGLKESTTYSYTLVACDEANNCSAPSSAAVVTTPKASPSLSSLALSCPTSIAAKASGVCSTSASYTDGSSRDVTATLSSSDTASLVVTTSGLTANSIAADTQVTITASYSENGVTRTSTAAVTVKAPVLSSIAISCPSSMNAGTIGSCNASATYSDGNSKSVSSSFSSNNASLVVAATGNLSAGSVSVDTQVSITATYTENSVSRTAVAVVLIKAPTLTSLSISCPASMNAKSSGSCSGSATFTDGSSKAVSPSWSSSNASALAVANGNLTAGDVSADTQVTVNATYTESNITKISTAAIVIKTILCPRTQLWNGTACVAASAATCVAPNVWDSTNSTCAPLTIEQCKNNQSLSGCTALCSTTPGGCPTVNYTQCLATPDLGGCAALLASCKSRPDDPLCTGGAATIAQCKINPALSGCTALCSATPGVCGEPVVTIAQCVTTPSLSGCAALCSSNPGTCSSTPITVAQCAANPNLPGCAALCAATTCSCIAPQVLQNGVCVAPLTCQPPQELRFGACVTPLVCVPPQILQAGVCITPLTSTAQVLSVANSDVKLDASGALVISKATAANAPIELSSSAQEKALIKLETLAPVSFKSGDTTLQYTDQAGSAQLVVRTVDNKPQLEVAKGTVQIESGSAKTKISVMSSDDNQTVGAITTQTTADKVIIVKSETIASVFVGSGEVKYQGPGQTAAVSVFKGEGTHVDSGGNVTQVFLGSVNGLSQVPGDPLTVKIEKASATKIPVLEGPLPRFNNTVSLLDIIGDQIKIWVGNPNGQVSYDRTTGVITYMLGNKAYRYIALGDVQVKLNQFSGTSASASAGGAFTLASRGIQLSLSGALGYFSDLQTALKAADPKGSLNLKPTGAIEARLGGGRYGIMPGQSATLPTNPNSLPGFESDASGYAVFRDHLGTLQTLYPAFLDEDTLNATFKQALPAIVMASKGDGTVGATLGGQSYILRPQYSVIEPVVGHAADPYWFDSGLIFLHNADKSAQGISVQ